MKRLLGKKANRPFSWKERRSREAAVLAMASSRETPQERRDRYLKLAAEAEINAARLSEPKAKAAWIDLAVSWMLMASEISAEPKSGRKRKPSRGGKT